MSSQYFNIIPSNNSNAGYAFSDGQNLINFVLGSQGNTLAGTSIRLNGRFETKTGSAADGEFNINPRVALLSLIDTLSISSHETGQLIESIKFYPRFLSSYLSTLQSEDDISSFMSVANGSSQTLGGSKTGVSSNSVDANNVQDFSIALPCGLFLSGRVPLDKVKGLFISLTLSNDQTLYRADAGKSPQYKITNVHLSGRMDAGSPQMSQMEYNSVSSYYGIINSSYGSIQYNLGLSSVLGAWLNFVPSEFINNYTYDAIGTYPLMSSSSGIARPSEVTFLRGGVRFPLDYNIVDEYTANQTLFNSQITLNYMSAIRKFSKIGRTCVSPLNTNVLANMAADADNISGSQVYGIGVRFDSTSDAGSDFSTVPFGVSIKSDLQTNYSNSAYLFIHHKNTLVFDNGGLQVLS